MGKVKAIASVMQTIVPDNQTMTSVKLAFQPILQHLLTIRRQN